MCLTVQRVPQFLRLPKLSDSHHPRVRMIFRFQSVITANGMGLHIHSSACVTWCSMSLLCRWAHQSQGVTDNRNYQRVNTHGWGWFSDFQCHLRQQNDLAHPLVGLCNLVFHVFTLQLKQSITQQPQVWMTFFICKLVTTDLHIHWLVCVNWYYNSLLCRFCHQSWGVSHKRN